MARNQWLLSVFGVLGVGLAFCGAARAERSSLSSSQPDVPQTVLRIRADDDRIREVFRYAIKHSPAFDDLVQTLEQQPRFLYVEEGPCADPRTSCLHLMPTAGSADVRIRIDPRQGIQSVVARLAHELYHASEIARHPTAVDADSVRALYERIGYRIRPCSRRECWETRAAVAFEALVTKELKSW